MNAGVNIYDVRNFKGETPADISWKYGALSVKDFFGSSKSDKHKFYSTYLKN